jgi:hypothetical protein
MEGIMEQNSADFQIARASTRALAFQLAFAAILRDFAQSKGPDAKQWIEEAEAKHINDIRKFHSAGMSLEMEGAILSEVISEFQKVFQSVRAQL